MASIILSKLLLHKALNSCVILSRTPTKEWDLQSFETRSSLQEDEDEGRPVQQQGVWHS